MTETRQPSCMARPRSVTLEVNITPTQAIRAFRELAEAADWEWERDEGSRLVDRMMIIMPIANVTRTFRLAILSGDGKGLILTAWQEVAGSSGGITKVEWKDFEKSQEALKQSYENIKLLFPKEYLIQHPKNRVS
mgnify:CR=1 FL=1